MKAEILVILAFSLLLGTAFAEGTPSVGSESSGASVTPMRVSSVEASPANSTGGTSGAQTDSRTTESGAEAGGSTGTSSSGEGRGGDNSSSVQSSGEATVSAVSQGGNASREQDASRGDSSPNNNSETMPQGETNRWQLTVISSNGQTLDNAGEIDAVQISPGRVEVQSRTGNASPTLLAGNGSGREVEIEAEISSANSNTPSLLRVQAMERETLLRMNGTEVSTAETLRIRNRTMYLERNGTEYRLNVLPSDLEEAGASLAPSQNITLGFEGDAPAYQFRATERRRFLGLFEVDSETAFSLNARNGSIMREEGPWWGFMAPVDGELREALNRIQERAGAEEGEN